MKRHFGKWLTAVALAVGCTVMTANAFADTDGHWAESAINKWSGGMGSFRDMTMVRSVRINPSHAALLREFWTVFSIFRTPLPRIPSRIPPGPTGRTPS